MTGLPHEDLSARWRAARGPAGVVHLDTAGCSRASLAVLAAQVDHLSRESSAGGYVAEAEVAPLVGGARQRLTELLGAPGASVSLVDSATTAFAVLLAAWPLPIGARVGVVRSEFGSNRMALAADDRVRLVELPCGPDARLDLEALADRLAHLDLVTFPHIASQRGVLQPAAEAAGLCRAAGVPLLLDVAQSLGQVDTAGIGASAYVGTSRKWLCGPRGVGFAVVEAELSDRLRPRAPLLATHDWCSDHPVPMPGVPRLETGECAVAGRVGLAVALQELLVAGAASIHERVAALGVLARGALEGCAGWRVVEPVGERSGVVTLRPPSDVDVLAVQRRLREAGVLVGAVPVKRAPADLPVPVLRVSAHVDAVADDVWALVEALPAATG